MIDMIDRCDRYMIDRYDMIDMMRQIDLKIDRYDKIDEIDIIDRQM